MATIQVPAYIGVDELTYTVATLIKNNQSVNKTSVEARAREEAAYGTFSLVNSEYSSEFDEDEWSEAYDLVADLYPEVFD